MDCKERKYIWIVRKGSIWIVRKGSIWIVRKGSIYGNGW